MKIWGFAIIVIVILAMICSPVLAISKSDLMSYYRTDPLAFSNSTNQNKPVPSITPTPLQTLTPNAMPFPKWADPSFLKPFSKPSIPSSPLKKPSTDIQSCPPSVPVGALRLTMAFVDCSPLDYCVNPETGERYPVATDALGSRYFVKPGCPCTWADV